MKIAFIKRNFSFHGGAERYLHTLLQSLMREKFEIHIFSNNWLNEANLFFHHIPIVSFGSFLKAYSFNRNLNIDLKNFDCVISFERTTNQHIYRAGEGCHKRWLELRSLIESRLKKISFKLNPLHRFYLKLEREIFEKTPLIIANSVMVKNEITTYYGISPSKITVIYNGVDTNKFSPENKKERDKLRKIHKIPTDKKIILFVGSGFKRKGLLTLLKALAVLRNQKYLLLVVGKGNFEKYKKIAKALNISDRIHFLGVTKNIEKLYAMSDLFVLPTIYDPFSNATLEAMASGLPVITTLNNGVAELIDEGKEGFILKNIFDFNELADKIDTAMDSSEQMGDFAREKVKELTIEKATEEFVKCMKKFLS